EDGDSRQAAAGEHVVETEHRAGSLFGEQAQRFLVHARRRNVITDPVHTEQCQREQNAVPQVTDGEQVFERVLHTSSHPGLMARPYTYASSTSTVPPAAAIFSAALPLNLCARTVSFFETSPRASTLIGSRASPTSPMARIRSGVTSAPSANRSDKASRFTTAYSTRNGLWN